MTPDSVTTVTVTKTVINLPFDFPRNPRPAQADEVMTQIGAALNMDLGAVKLGGYWVIGTTQPTWSPISDTNKLRRKFDHALADALHMAVVTDIPL